MRVLHIIKSMNPSDGGIVQYVANFCSYAMAEGHTANVLCQDPVNSEFLSHYNFRIISLAQSTRRYGFSLRLNRWLKQNIRQYDLVIINGLWTFIGHSTGRIARSKGIPYLVIPHGMLDISFRKNYPFKHIKKLIYFLFFERLTLNNSFSVVFTSPSERLSSVRTFPFFNASYFNFSLGVPHPPSISKIVRSSFIRKFPQWGDRRLILFFGRIHEIKGCDLIIKAFHLTNLSSHGYHLVFAGPCTNSYKDYLINLSEYNSISSNVTWTGMLSGSDKWSMLCSGEVFILPSHHENFGMAMVEALACGLPVLISDKVETHPIVSTFNAGIIDSDTLEGTIRLLKRWLSISDLERTQMKRNAVSCFEAEFHISHSVNKILSLKG